MKTIIQFVCAAVLLALVAPASFAAKGGKLSGKVVDPEGAAVVGATIRVASPSGTEIVATTDKEGRYDVEGVPGGKYLVEVSALGFGTDTHESVEIPARADTALDVTLKIAAVSEQVTVTAAGTPQARTDVAKSIDVVTDDEASARQNIALPEALTTIAGLHIQRQGGPGSLTTLRFRGLRYQDTSVLIDDMRFRDASDLYGSLGTFIEDLMLTGVERVEVVRGAGSTLYGTNAVGGVINVIPLRGSGAPKFEGLVEGGSLGTFHGRFSSSGGTDRFGYSAGVDQYNVTNGVDGDDDYRATSVAGRASYRFTDRMELSGNVLFNDSRVDLNGNPFFRGVNGGSLFAPNPVVFADAPNDPDDVRDGRIFQGALRFNHAVNSIWSYTVSYSATDTEREFTYGPDSDPAFYAEVAPFTFDYDGDGKPDVSSLGNLLFEGNVQTFDGRTRFILGSHNVLTAGFEAERETYFQYFPGPFGSSQQAYNLFGIDFDFDGINDASRDKQWTYAAFGYDQISLLDGRLQIGLGARWQGFHVSDTEAFLGTSNLVRPGDGVTQTIPASLQGIDEKSAVTGDGSISYAFRSSGTRLWAHVGNSFRAPSLYERFSNVSDFVLVTSGLLRAGDPTLKPELSLSVDGGIEQTAFEDKLRLEATYFYNHAQRQIDFASFLNPVTFESEDPLGLGRFGGYVNTRGGLSRGVELTATAKPIRSLDLKGVYTYVKSDVVLPSSIVLEDGDIITKGESYRAPGIPVHQFGLQAIERIGRFTVDFDLLAQSEHDASLFEPISFASRRFTFDSYARANLAASYTMPVSDRTSITFFGRAENLFDVDILENGIRQPGIAGYGGVKVSF